MTGFFINGINRIRDLHGVDVQYGQLGTQGGEAIGQDLNAPVAATELPVTRTFADKTNTYTYFLNSQTGTGKTYREVAFGSTGPKLAHWRQLYPGIEHLETDEITLIGGVYYDQPDPL